MNLATIKRNIKSGMEFEVVNHRMEHWIGQIRKPNKIQTNGVYTIVKGDPEHNVSKANNGKGVWMEYGKASDWEFYADEQGKEHCVLYQGEHIKENMIIDFVFIE